MMSTSSHFKARKLVRWLCIGNVCWVCMALFENPLSKHRTNRIRISHMTIMSCVTHKHVSHISMRESHSKPLEMSYHRVCTEQCLGAVCDVHACVCVCVPLCLRASVCSACMRTLHAAVYFPGMAGSVRDHGSPCVHATGTPMQQALPSK